MSVGRLGRSGQDNLGFRVGPFENGIKIQTITVKNASLVDQVFKIDLYFFQLLDRDRSEINVFHVWSRTHTKNQKLVSFFNLLAIGVVAVEDWLAEFLIDCILS